jgi:hypothetical protein
MDRSQIRYRPANDPQLRMQCLVIVRDAIVVFVEGLAVCADQDCTKRSVPVVECGAGKFDTAMQALQIDFAQDHRPEVYGRCLTGSGQCLGSGDRLRDAGDDGRHLQCLEDGFSVDAGLAQGVFVGDHAVRTPVD